MSALAALALLQVALTAGWLAARLLERAHLPPRARLRAHRLLLLLALAAPVLVRPVEAPWTPPAALRTATTDAAPVQVAVALPGPVPAAQVAVPQHALDLGAVLLGLVLLVGGARFVVATGRLRRRLARARPWRTVEGVAVRVDATATAPYAARTPWRAVVVLDPGTLADASARPLALRQELQHHAQGDPAFAWLWLAARCLLGWNPAVGAWARLAAEVEEQACDAAVVAHPTVSPRAYGRLLLSVAARPPAPAGATGLPPRSPLHRRLTMLARPAPARPARSLALSLGAAGLLLLTTGAARGLATDQRLASVDLHDSGLPVGLDTDHAVVEVALARVQGRHAGFTARGLERRDAWAPLVDGALAEAGLPAWLAAVPLVESGYTNWGAPGVPSEGSAAPGTIPGRGLWMFIAPTARDYGLRVEGTVDERFDPELETAAAVALLTDLHAEFGDWRLALAAYNQGPVVVRRAIERGGTRDPWALVAGGWLNTYSADVVATAAVMQAR